MAKLTLLVLSAILALTLAQRQQPRPFRPAPAISILSSGRDSSGRYNPGQSGRYSGGSDGRYTPDNSGRYNGNDGRYTPDDSGRYNPDGSGAYSGQSGAYQHQDDRYQHQDERYQHQADRFGGSGSNRGAGGGSGANRGAGAGAGLGAGSRSGAGSARPISSGVLGSLVGGGSGISSAGGFGAPVSQRQGSAAGLYDNRNYAILRQEGTVDEDGYHYLYETENGITGEEQGRLANRNTDQEAMRASGFFTYTGPDSVVYTVRYTADENGFVPQADHLPTPPPVPEAIARALEWQRQNPTL